MKSDSTDIIYGRWPVREALQAGPVAKVYIAKGVGGGPIDEIAKLAREKKVPFHWVDRRQLDQMAGENHQGVVAEVAPFSFTPLDRLWKIVKETKTHGACALFLDSITDPQNLGSILRSAVFFGVPAVVIPKWRAATLTGAVVRASAGAARLIAIAQVPNLVNAMEEAKKQGIWLVGADMDGQDARQADLPRPFALVIGSEGEGLHQLVRKKCEVVVSIGGDARRTGIHSLNVSVAAGILLQQFS